MSPQEYKKEQKYLCKTNKDENVRVNECQWLLACLLAWGFMACGIQGENGFLTYSVFPNWRLLRGARGCWRSVRSAGNLHCDTMTYSSTTGKGSLWSPACYPLFHRDHWYMMMMMMMMMIIIVVILGIVLIKNVSYKALDCTHNMYCQIDGDVVTFAQIARYWNVNFEVSNLVAVCREILKKLGQVLGQLFFVQRAPDS